MSQEPKVTRFGADPTVDQELATKAYVDAGGGGGATLSNQRDIITADETTTSTSYVDTDLSVTLANRSGGNFQASCSVYVLSSGGQAVAAFRYVDGATNLSGWQIQTRDGAGARMGGAGFAAGNLDGDVVTLQFATNAGTLTLIGADVGGLAAESQLTIIEMS